MYYKQNINQDYVLWGAVTTSVYKPALSAKGCKLLPNPGICLLTKMGAALHFSGFQTHFFTARVARNLP